ncbi:hypothetical protein M9H77_22298 [Catharanthus roseus]|uniref:Uncharacterized protein n=1 Tax=Catharanthus roseus TaxID=4058 RepID=A0ACC0ART4_CATRO|nr:hypothetical protein M9H77_22298 [Catharanthus roseus]
MEGMEIIPNLFNEIGWGPLLIVNELFYPGMIYEFYANLHKDRIQRVGNITHQWVLSRVGGRDNSFYDRLLNSILETPDDATQTSSTKCLPYGGFLTKIFQYFVLNLVGVSDHIGAGKIYNKHTFKKMGFEENEEGVLVKGGQDESDEDNEDVEGNEGQEAMNVVKEDSEIEPEEETHRKEIRQKKRQERAEEGSSSGTEIEERVTRMEARDRDKGH